METFVILFSATNKLALMKGQVYRVGNVQMGIAAVKHFMFGLGVALVCGSTATAEYASWSCKASTAQFTIFSDKMVMVGIDGIVVNWTCKKGFCVSMKHKTEPQRDSVSTAQILYEKPEDGSKATKPLELRHHFFVRRADGTIHISPTTNNLIEPLNCEEF